MAVVSHTSQGGITATDGLTRYSGLGPQILQADTVENDVKTLFRTAGTFSKMYAYVSTNTLTTASSTARLRVDGADVNLAVVVGPGLTGWFSDTSNTDTITAGQEVSFMISTPGQAGTVSAVFKVLHIDFEASANTVKRLIGGLAGFTNLTATTKYTPLGGKVDNETTAIHDYEFNQSCTLKNLAVLVTVNSRSDAAVTLKTADGAGTALGLSVSCTASTTGWFEDTSNTDTIAANDLVQLRWDSATSTGTFTPTVTAVDVVSTDSKYPLIAAEQNSSISAGQTFFGIEGGTSWRDANIAVAETTATQDATFSNLFVNVSANTANGATTIALYQDGSTTALSLSVDASTTGIFEDTDSVSITAGELLATTCNHTGASGNITLATVGYLVTVGGGPATSIKDLIGTGIIAFAR